MRAGVEPGVALAAAFERSCRRLGLHLSDRPVIVATSGGADSACALLLTRQVAPHAKLIACYVDHGLRPRTSIDKDIQAVRAQAQAAGAATLVRKARLAPPKSGSTEERAREARYRVLAEAARSRGAALVLTGHQRDDLVETAVLALTRGSGIDGVASMRPLRELAAGIALARPLLWAAKEECEQLVCHLGLPFSRDETNADTTIPRNAVRRLLANLESALPQAGRGISRSVALLAQDKELLDGLSTAACQQARVGQKGELRAAQLRKLPHALLRRVIRAAIAASGSGLRGFSFTHCDAIARAIKEGRGGRFHAGEASVLLSSGKMTVEQPRGERLARFEPVAIDLAKTPLSYNTPLGTATFALKRARTSTHAPEQPLALDAARLKGSALQLRLPQSGDVCVPPGRTRPTSLARYLGKAGVAQSRRGLVPLLCAGGRIAAVVGHRVMASFEPRPGNAILEVQWHAADT